MSLPTLAQMVHNLEMRHSETVLQLEEFIKSNEAQALDLSASDRTITNLKFQVKTLQAAVFDAKTELRALQLICKGIADNCEGPLTLDQAKFKLLMIHSKLRDINPTKTVV